MAAGAQKAVQSHWSPAVICSAEIIRRNLSVISLI